MSSALRAKELDDVLYGPAVASGATGDAFAAIAILLRFLARRLGQQGLWYDDFVLMPSIAVTLACSLTSWATFSNNRIPGNDPLQLSPEMTTRFLKVFYLYQAVGPIGHACHKLSLLALLYRRFRSNNKYRNYKRIVLGSVVFLGCWTIAFSLASLFQCRPVNKLWDPDIPGSCTNPKHLVGTVEFSNVGLQIWVLGLAFYRILRTTLFRTERFRWTITFCLGVILIGTACALAYFNVVQLTPFFEGQTYSLNGAVMFYLLEINLGIICACIPVMPPVFELCCAPRGRKKHQSDRPEESIKALELEADDPSLELADPSNLKRDPTGRLRAELFDPKVDRGELTGTIPAMELPTNEKCIEIDGREIPKLIVPEPSVSPRQYSRSSTWASSGPSPISSLRSSPGSSRGPSPSSSLRSSSGPSPQLSLKHKALPALPPQVENYF